ncbi:hypothetical protein ACVW00_000589 [Marmoricola sp. URHA0025 HA25]
MKVRTFTAGIGVAALAISGLALGTATTASADPLTTPSATDIVGVGSDTIEFVVQNLADAWNTSHTPKVASFNATPVAGFPNVILRTAPWNGTADPTTIPRPNGSGAGKATLFGAGNNNNVNFARSSSSLSTTEAAALTQFPFAVDGLKMAVSGSGTPSHAPASVKIADVVNIYKGVYTTWNQIPGNSAGSTAAIHPLIPQSGSGTRSFFLSELKAGNGGVDVTLAPSVAVTQEHSPTDIQNDPDAIAPFSTARASSIASSVISLEGGYRARRAVYDVVRNADAGSDWATALFGTAGFWCSDAGRTQIIAAGFEPLQTTGDATHPGGQCGLNLTAPPSNLNVFGATVSTTSLNATSGALHTVDLDATVSSGAGTVQFFDGANQVGGDVAPSGGHATAHLTGITGGSHTFVAKFLATSTSANTDSQGSKTVSVVSSSTTTATVAPGTFGHGGTATVSVSAEGTAATGNVTINVGAYQATSALSGGTATFSIPGTFAVGSQSFSASYAGNPTTLPSNDTKVYTVGKSAVSVSETFKAKIKHGKRAVGNVVVALAPGSSVKAGGTIVVKKGTKIVGRGTLVNGVVTIKLAKLPVGKNKLVATYSGSGDSLGGTLKFVIVQK